MSRIASELVWLGRLLFVAAALVVFLGTVVTSSGPHGGDETARRFDIDLHRIAQLHGSAVMLFLAFTLVTIWSLWRSGAPTDVLQRAELLAVVLVAQGAIGYIQYFSRLPVFLDLTSCRLSSDSGPRRCLSHSPRISLPLPSEAGPAVGPILHHRYRGTDCRMALS